MSNLEYIIKSLNDAYLFVALPMALGLFPGDIEEW